MLIGITVPATLILLLLLLLLLLRRRRQRRLLVGVVVVIVWAALAFHVFDRPPKKTNKTKNTLPINGWLRGCPASLTAEKTLAGGNHKPNEICKFAKRTLNLSGVINRTSGVINRTSGPVLGRFWAVFVGITTRSGPKTLPKRPGASPRPFRPGFGPVSSSNTNENVPKPP